MLGGSDGIGAACAGNCQEFEDADVTFAALVFAMNDCGLVRRLATSAAWGQPARFIRSSWIYTSWRSWQLRLL